jgi:PhnB protein
VTQGAIPYLLYRDAGAALEWLGRAFGFVETVRMPGPDGSVGHAEMDAGGARVFLGSPGPDFEGPKAAGVRTALVYVYVDDVDATFALALDAGGTAVEEPNDQPYGERRAAIEDPEGHHWYLAAPL